MTERLSYTVKEAAEVTGLSESFLKAAIHSSDPARRLPAKGASLRTKCMAKGSASKFVILRGDLVAWLYGMSGA